MLILNKIRKPYLLLLLLPLGLATNSHLFAAARTVTHAGSHGIDNQVFGPQPGVPMEPAPVVMKAGPTMTGLSMPMPIQKRH